MTRADAWLLDPFGARLGRWGGAPSGSAAPAWWQPIADLVGDGFITVYTEGVETADPGAQVVSWDDVRGGVVWAQTGAGSTRPALAANGIVLDGIDDRLEADEYAPICDGAYTLIIGFDDPNNTVTAPRTLESCATATTLSGGPGLDQVVYSNPSVTSATRMRFYLSDNSTSGIASLVSLGALGAGPYDLAFRTAAPGGGAEVMHLLETPTSVVTTTRPAGVLAHALLTLGARRYGTSPTINQYWQGRVRYAILADTLLDNAALTTIRTALVAQGLMI